MNLIEGRRSFRIGEEASLSKTISDTDIEAFVEITGDRNLIHLDDEYARRTRFGGRIAHGMLAAGLVSGVLGTRLPELGAIYLSQQLRFTAPVRPGDSLIAGVRVPQCDSRTGRVSLQTTVVNQDGFR